MPKTRTSAKRNDEPERPRVLHCEQKRDDGFPLGAETVVFSITAEVSEREYQRIADAWETGADYALEVAGKAHVGTVKGNIVLTERGTAIWTVQFDLHEDPGQWAALLKS
ncbi:hypothetical protein KKH18_06945 [bacterium]|nr:hypothetical protein [bacterium]